MNASSLLLGSAFAAYAAAGVAAFASLRGPRALDRALIGSLLLAVVLHGAALGARWAQQGTGPFITMHEVLSSNVWSLAVVYTAAAWRWRVIRPAAAVVMPVLFLMMAWIVATDPTPGHQPATYRTAWLYVHVAFGKVFLGCVLVAVGLSGVILLRAAGARMPRLEALPDDARLEALAFRFMAVALVFESLMLIAGAIWAQDAWGRYWAWDPLETWAFVTWILVATFVHARSAFAMRPASCAVMVIAVFAIAFLTFFGTPFISTAPHKGAI